MSQPSAKTALIVLGMHRSGTSALAGVLGQLGVALPQDLMAPADMNPKGFFESDRITGLNERLLASVGFTWWDPRRFPDDWFETAEAAEFLVEAVAALQDDYGDAPLFVIKDPRICRLMPFWRVALDRFGARVLVVHTHRSPWDVAASLTRWADYETDFGLVLWLRHVLDAEADSRDLPRSFTSYDLLMSDWRGTVDRIAADLVIAWPVHPNEAGPGIEDFLSRDLRHFQSWAEVGPEGQPLPPIVAEALAGLEACVREPGVVAADAPFTELRSALDAVSPLYDGLALRTVHRAREVAHHLGHIAELQEAYGGQLRAAQDQNGVLASSLSERQQDLQRTYEQLGQAQQALQCAEGDLGRTRDELRRKTGELAEQSRRLNVAERRLGVAEVQLRQMSSRQVDEIDQRIRLALALDDTTAMSGTFTRLADVVEAETARLTETRTRLVDEAEQLRREVHNLQAAHDNALAERDAARDRGMAREAELLASTSWRVTAPLRRLSVALRGMRRP